MYKEGENKPRALYWNSTKVAPPTAGSVVQGKCPEQGLSGSAYSWLPRAAGHSETTAPVTPLAQEQLTPAADLDFSHVLLVLQAGQNARVAGSQRFLVRFQRKPGGYQVVCWKVRVHESSP